MSRLRESFASAINRLDSRRIAAFQKDKAARRAIICAAISSRKLIELYYQGGFRLVEPFGLGVPISSDEVDNESLLCYQVSGHSESVYPPRMEAVTDFRYS